MANFIRKYLIPTSSDASMDREYKTNILPYIKQVQNLVWYLQANATDIKNVVIPKQYKDTIQLLYGTPDQVCGYPCAYTDAATWDVFSRDGMVYTLEDGYN